MSDKTGIEWTDATWNPTKGCDRVSAGCDHCYAMTLAPRLKAMGSPAYQLDGDPRTSGPGFLAHEWPAVLDQPIRWTKPRRIFVNSMSDLFHDSISDEYIARVFAVMSLAPQHTFQILTKRHARMRSLLSRYPSFTIDVLEAAREIDPSRTDLAWPLPNVWLGVSAEDQHWYNIRWPALRETPAAVRFISFEPLLDSISLFANSMVDGYPMPDWCIVGGESGPGARPMRPAWARQLRNECIESGIPFLFKQWGEHEPRWNGDEPAVMHRVGKKAAGRELDGRTWDEYPGVGHADWTAWSSAPASPSAPTDPPSVRAFLAGTP